jgi:hypothetical protein
MQLPVLQGPGAGITTCLFVWRMIRIGRRQLLRPTLRYEATYKALRVARFCVDVAATRPCEFCVHVPGVRVARLAGQARSDMRRPFC